MATYVNQTKNTSSMANQLITEKVLWADTVVSWADADIGLGWAAFKGTGYDVQAKNTSVMVNQTKN